MALIEPETSNREGKMAMAKLSGGGIQSNKNVSPPVKTGAPSRASSPAAANQLGASTAFKKESVETGPGGSRVPLGNEVALNSKSASGQGRTVMPCGSQGQHGSVNKGESPRSEPRGFDSRGPLKGEV
jgi:hypothetical protein